MYRVLCVIRVILHQAVGMGKGNEGLRRLDHFSREKSRIFGAYLKRVDCWRGGGQSGGWWAGGI